MKLVVVSAGLSVPSSTRLLADRLAAATTARVPADAGLQVVELRDLAVEIAHNFTNGFPGPNLAPALDAVRAADGLIVVTPVFSASYSGLFKSFFDVLDKDALIGKPVLLAATGGSARHSLVLEHALRPLFAYLRATTVPTAVYAASEDWGAEGLAERIERAAGELAGLLGGHRGASVSEAGPAAGTPHEPETPATPGYGDDIAPAPGPGAASAHGSGLPPVVPFEQQLAALRP
ncbi:FMN reductase [Streptomyces poonensis]|uniref:Oxidoreductase n=1 Tax=Streptomyces poonensis TaxID=68255 RepID=A0A918PMX8_9ACTN|nr:FMN reductase [Streptomyces poonensis]GGZ15290.1 oxidoreductase [Streptomyces poonensis]GLJ91478.1 oxidoreductase [Streptomyces poonensis]